MVKLLRWGIGAGGTRLWGEVAGVKTGSVYTKAG